jgi:hypothetical protein
MALHGANRQMEPFGDLAIAQSLADRPENLRLAVGDAGAREPIGHPSPVACHPRIVL